MSETVADLELDDEHVTIGLDDTLVEGCKRLVSIPSGILVVLDDEEQVKGVIVNDRCSKRLVTAWKSKKRLARKLWKWMSSRYPYLSQSLM